MASTGYFVAAGSIAGIVIGSLFGLAMLVTCIVCLCSACNKTGTTRGRVVYPNTTGQASVAVVNTTNFTNQGTAYPPHGQAYPQHGAYPPQGQAHPGQAYPPPPPAYPAQGPAYPGQGPAYPPPESGQFVPPPKYSAT
ncbi:protein shisa-4-like isoform X2 [Pecten maximus]|uniref:protein shisa-4-like isoform X2 n=1 Tax=Pecten maximus TaxID=6579 RepID=UPI001458E789|nr:protein shisa-4-like isoform X2 [Pecten maximus]